MSNKTVIINIEDVVNKRFPHYWERCSTEVVLPRGTIRVTSSDMYDTISDIVSNVDSAILDKSIYNMVIITDKVR